MSGAARKGFDSRRGRREPLCLGRSNVPTVALDGVQNKRAQRHASAPVLRQCLALIQMEPQMVEEEALAKVRKVLGE